MKLRFTRKRDDEKPRTIDADELLAYLNAEIDRWRDRECDGVNSHSYGVALSAACRATAFEAVRGYVLRDQADRVWRAAVETGREEVW